MILIIRWIPTCHLSKWDTHSPEPYFKVFIRSRFDTILTWTGRLFYLTHSGAQTHDLFHHEGEEASGHGCPFDWMERLSGF